MKNNQTKNKMTFKFRPTIILLAIFMCLSMALSVLSQTDETAQQKNQAIAKNIKASQPIVADDKKVETNTIAAPVKPKSPSADYHKNEFYAGYSYERFGINKRGFNGFESSYTRNLTRYVGIKGEFDYHYKSGIATCCVNTIFKESLKNIAGGIQLKDNSKAKRFKPFGYGLAGVTFFDGKAYCSGIVCDGANEKYFSMIFGGGIDIKAGKRFDIRIIQVDYHATRNQHLNNRWNNSFRIGAGIVFH